MRGAFRAVTQVFCVLVLVLSLSLATVAPVMAADLPTTSPTTAQYDLDDPSEVVVDITWGMAKSVVAVTDDDGHTLTQNLGSEYIVLVKHLIILDYYLKNKLKNIGDSVELVIKFDVGATTLNITAIGTQPSIFPTTAQYNLSSPAPVKTTVTWGIASSPGPVVDDAGHTLTTNEGSVTGAEVTIYSAYLTNKLKDIGDDVVLTINFNRGNSANFTITAIGTQPSISPITAQYNIDSPDDVKTTITWGSAGPPISIKDDDGDTLTPTTPTSQYKVDGTQLTVYTQYLKNELTNIGDSVVLTIDFNVGSNATFTITATGVNAVLSPQARDYDLENPAEAKTTITWGTAKKVDSIKDDDGYTLARNTDYTVPDRDSQVSGNLTIPKPYLAGKLVDIGDKVVLTIKFDRGANATFTITAVGIQPTISPKTKDYDLDNPADAVTTITWGTASNVTSIVDNDNYRLVNNTDYTVNSTTLTIRYEPYLEGKHVDIGDSVVLTIDFDIGSDATFTIASMGIQPSIFPPTADHDIIASNNVSTIITWGSAKYVASIVDDSGYLLDEGVHYIVTPLISSGVSRSSNLTILESTYLSSRLRMFGEKLVLTIGFDVGREATLTITVPGVCFIATAAYGTPMAEEIQILREFRDEYLLTNQLGQALVGVYYRVSPPVAEFIAEHPSLKPAVRAGLLPAVAMSTVAVNASPVEKMAMVALLVLISVAVAVWVIRRRGRSPEHA